MGAEHNPFSSFPSRATFLELGKNYRVHKAQAPVR